MRKCKESSITQIELLSDKEWHDSFIEYFLTERRFNKENINLTISTLSCNNELRKKLENRVEETISRDFDAIGVLGEAHMSYLLEKKMNVYLTMAGWKDHPFEVTKGTDLVGVCLDEMIVALVQVKTRRGGSTRQSTIDKLKADISLTKLDSRFKSIYGSSSYVTISSIFKTLVAEGKVIPEYPINQIQNDIFLRIGAVLTGNINFWGNIDDADPGDSSQSRPIQLILYEIEGLPSKLNLIAVYDAAATSGAAGISVD